MAVVCSSFSAAEHRARRILRLHPADYNADEVERATILSRRGDHDIGEKYRNLADSFHFRWCGCVNGCPLLAGAAI